MDDRRLRIYLQDHFAGATAGLELARRTASRNRGNEWGERLGRMVTEITEERELLRSVMKRFGAQPHPVKSAAGWAMEKAGRLKLNGQLTGYSPLSRVEELEALRLGVEGRGSLWRVLRETRRGDARLEGLDLDDLVARADRQSAELETMSIEAARTAFGTPKASRRKR